MDKATHFGQVHKLVLAVLSYRVPATLLLAFPTASFRQSQGVFAIVHIRILSLFHDSCFSFVTLNASTQETLHSFLDTSCRLLRWPSRQ